MNVVCCVDDAPEKQGRCIMGVQIMGTTEDIPELVERCDIETILLAIPTLDEAGKRRILPICNRTKCNVRILPDIVKLITDGKDLPSRVRDVRVEDVLGRDEINLSTPFQPSWSAVSDHGDWRRRVHRLRAVPAAAATRPPSW